MPKVGDIIRAEDIKSGGFIGQIIEFPSNLIPANTLLCDGSEISRDTYSELFAVINTIYGEGDGSTTFNIPDYRGAFLRCTGGNADVLGTLQGDAIRNITGNMGTVIATIMDGPFHSVGNYYNILNGNFCSSVYAYMDVSLQVPTATENRPINYAVNVCVVYE